MSRSTSNTICVETLKHWEEITEEKWTVVNKNCTWGWWVIRWLLPLPKMLTVNSYVNFSHKPKTYSLPKVIKRWTFFAFKIANHPLLKLIVFLIVTFFFKDFLVSIRNEMLPVFEDSSLRSLLIDTSGMLPY